MRWRGGRWREIYKSFTDFSRPISHFAGQVGEPAPARLLKSGLQNVAGLRGGIHLKETLRQRRKRKVPKSLRLRRWRKKKMPLIPQNSQMRYMKDLQKWTFSNISTLCYCHLFRCHNDYFKSWEKLLNLWFPGAHYNVFHGSITRSQMSQSLSTV